MENKNWFYTYDVNLSTSWCWRAWERSLLKVCEISPIMKNVKNFAPNGGPSTGQVCPSHSRRQVLYKRDSRQRTTQSKPGLFVQVVTDVKFPAADLAADLSERSSAMFKNRNRQLQKRRENRNVRGRTRKCGVTKYQTKGKESQCKWKGLSWTQKPGYRMSRLQRPPLIPQTLCLEEGQKKGYMDWDRIATTSSLVTKIGLARRREACQSTKKGLRYSDHSIW